MTPTIAIETMTGADVEHVIPADVREWMVQARDSTVQLRTVTGSTAYWTLTPLAPLKFSSDDLSAKSIFLDGTTSKIVEIIYITSA